jgi:glucose-1-phosphate thymidylyltransferase
MRGVILAGGSGTRLWPITKVVSKQLLPIYNKPLIFYSISTLMLAGIREILIITTPRDQALFQSLLGDGSQFNIRFFYETQKEPKGLAEAFIIGKDFIGESPVALILGDNIFHGAGLGRNLAQYQSVEGAIIFGSHVNNPSDYGVVDIDASGNPTRITEKPLDPQSNLAIPGLYFFDHNVVSRALAVTPSKRGELEITSILQSYLEDKSLQLEILPRGSSWFDAGTFSSLLEATQYVRTLENRQGQMIANLEEVSWLNGWIDDATFLQTNFTASGSQYDIYKNILISERNLLQS